MYTSNESPLNGKVHCHQLPTSKHWKYSASQTLQQTNCRESPMKSFKTWFVRVYSEQITQHHFPSNFNFNFYAGDTTPIVLFLKVYL